MQNQGHRRVQSNPTQGVPGTLGHVGCEWTRAHGLWTGRAAAHPGPGPPSPSCLRMFVRQPWPVLLVCGLCRGSSMSQGVLATAAAQEGSERPGRVFYVCDKIACGGSRRPGRPGSGAGPHGAPLQRWCSAICELVVQASLSRSGPGLRTRPCPGLPGAQGPPQGGRRVHVRGERAMAG